MNQLNAIERGHHARAPRLQSHHAFSIGSSHGITCNHYRGMIYWVYHGLWTILLKNYVLSAIIWWSSFLFYYLVGTTVIPYCFITSFSSKEESFYQSSKLRTSDDGMLLAILSGSAVLMTVNGYRRFHCLDIYLAKAGSPEHTVLTSRYVSLFFSVKTTSSFKAPRSVPGTILKRHLPVFQRLGHCLDCYSIFMYIFWKILLQSRRWPSRRKKQAAQSAPNIW